MIDAKQIIDAARHDVGIGIRVLDPEHLIRLVARECIVLAEAELHQDGNIVSIIDAIKTKFDIS